MPETAQRTRTSQSTFGVNVTSFSPWVSVWDTESQPDWVCERAVARRSDSCAAEVLDLDRPVCHDPQRRGRSRGRIVDAGGDVVRSGPVLLWDGVLAHDFGPRARAKNYVVSGDAYHAADDGDVPVVIAVQGYGMLYRADATFPVV
nr:MAG TPA: hypothetical protein [Caudoviricetes sp.]